jgi:hypothetical protein
MLQSIVYLILRKNKPNGTIKYSLYVWGITFERQEKLLSVCLSLCVLHRGRTCYIPALIVALRVVRTLPREVFRGQMTSFRGTITSCMRIEYLKGRLRAAADRYERDAERMCRKIPKEVLDLKLFTNIKKGIFLLSRLSKKVNNY